MQAVPDFGDHLPHNFHAQGRLEMALEQAFVNFLTWKQVMELGVVAYDYNPSTHREAGEQGGGGAKLPLATGDRKAFIIVLKVPALYFPKLVTLCFVLEFF